MRPSVISSVGAAVLVFAMSGVATAVTVTESGDAGSLPANAQTTTGAVDIITGTIAPDGTDEDMYRVCLTGGRTFSATTQGSELEDPMLFLFDASGRGVYANENETSGSGQSTLPAGHPLTPNAGGVYYLAISGFANVPLSQGERIFLIPPGGPGVRGPDGPGGASPVTGWTDTGGFPTPAYRIALTGTRSCLPTSKEECKNGGWQTYGIFKNQGDCVSFVATGGKNQPALGSP